MSSLPRQKLHILLIPGAGHRPIHYQKLTKILTSPPYDYEITSVDLAMVEDPHPETVSIASEARGIREKYLLPLINEKGVDVVLLPHSWGQIVSGEAAVGLTKHDRAAEGKAGGVVGVISMTGLYLPPGGKTLDAFGGEVPEWAELKEGRLIGNRQREMLYHDVPDAEAKAAVEWLGDVSYQSHITPAGEESVMRVPKEEGGGLEGKRYYIKTLDDQCIPPEAQDMMLGMMNHGTVEEGGKWKVIEIQGSHSPFLSGRVEELAEMVGGAVGDICGGK